MLIKKDRTNRENSIYQCDRCKNKMNVYNTYKIHLQTSKDLWVKKKWDLCNRCYKALVRGVENGRNG